MGVKLYRTAIQTFALVVLLGVATLSHSEGASLESTRPRLTSQRVSQLASTEAAKAGLSPSKFKADTPKYDAEGHSWRVYFKETGPQVAVDGTMLVVIDDLTGKGCVQQAESVGPCA
jgi:hypothetical protein